MSEDRKIEEFNFAVRKYSNKKLYKSLYYRVMADATSTN
jgi:hypothetical protein